MWNYVIPHFSNFLENINLTDLQHDDALTKANSIGKCLFSNYYEGEYNPIYTWIVGSYGKRTAIRPTTDVDLLFFLPIDKFNQYNNYIWNGQSALLQEVKQILQNTFPKTDMRADGQVVVVAYKTYKFEVVPAFLINQNVVICHTNNGGSWKTIYPLQEIQRLEYIDQLSKGSLRMLIKYLKNWKRENNVDIKSFEIELTACSFMQSWWSCYGYRISNPIFWHDWMVRDYFNYLSNCLYVSCPFTNDFFLIDQSCRNKASIAYNESLNACYYEYYNMDQEAKDSWKNIFGNKFTSLEKLLEKALLCRLLAS